MAVAPGEPAQGHASPQAYPLVDTHAHLDEVSHVEVALGRARSAGVGAVIAVGSDYASNLRVLELAETYPSAVYPALGLHPGQIGEMGQQGVERALAHIEEHAARVVALGEVGLDYHKRIRAEADKSWQQAVLREVLALARRYGKPVLVHSRYAWADALALVREANIKEAVFHWFTGPTSVLRGLLEAGYYISATPAVEYHQEHRRAVRQAALERLLLETDSPVAYPLGEGPERYQVQPADVVRVLRAVAGLRGMSEAELARVTTGNACRLFGLSPAVNQ